VAEYEILTGKHQLRVDPAHGSGAIRRNARSRYGDVAGSAPPRPQIPDIDVRDLAVYEQLLEVV